jgi:hypothetical protein
MLPIYEAIDLVHVIPENSGHTKPWVVLVNTPQGLASYVTKLYTPAQVNRFHCVTKEVICNVLARDFELRVPDCALIDVPEEFVLRLAPEHQQQFSLADPRLKFGSLKIDNVNSAISGLPKQSFSNRIDMATLFAFDNLIRNCDRGHPKTNLLIGSKEAYLIDHEMTLREADIDNINLDTHQIEDQFTRFHLFYPYLKKTRGENRRNLFNEFEEYLRLLNINALNPYFRQLTLAGFTDYSALICGWIEQVKQKSTIFVGKLRGSLQ